MLGTNEWDARPAPALHLFRTRVGDLRLYAAALEEELVSRLEQRLVDEPASPWASALPATHHSLLRLMADGGRRDAWAAGPVFLATPNPSFARGVAIDEENAAVLAANFPQWRADVGRRRPFLALVEAGHAVSVCASVRISTAAHCAGVETATGHRGRGHASAVVAAWIGEVRALGAAPFYSTTWDNPSSRAVAARLGMTLVGVDYRLG